MIDRLLVGWPFVPAGVQFDQSELAVKLGDIQLMQAGQPLAFDAKTASTYLKDTCSKHGTVKIFVTVGKGAGKGELVWLSGFCLAAAAAVVQIVGLPTCGGCFGVCFVHLLVTACEQKYFVLLLLCRYGMGL